MMLLIFRIAPVGHLIQFFEATTLVPWLYEICGRYIRKVISLLSEIGKDRERLDGSG